MKKYEVRISDYAFNDINDIYKYISEKLKAPYSAIAQCERIQDAIMNLQIFPERTRKVDYKVNGNLDLHKLLVDNYSILYVIEGDIVRVIGIVHSSADLENRTFTVE